MTKKKLLSLLKGIPMNAEIGYRPHDCGEDCPADDISFIHELNVGDFAKAEQGFEYVLV
jgi:hypothetical protein